jgi:RNA polymerase sigma-70 factor (ECF subfamily)
MADSVERVPAQVILRAIIAEAIPGLTKLAERLCATSADASDLVQDTVERAMRNGIPADVRNPSGWLATMLHHLFIDRCRAEARRPPHEPIEDHHDNITPIHVAGLEPAWSRVTMADIYAALEAISPTYREVYALHTFERLSYEAIAERLKINRITVGTRLTRARLELRKVLIARFGVERNS